MHAWMVGFEDVGEAGKLSAARSALLGS
jgi:hypothetical protein